MSSHESQFSGDDIAFVQLYKLPGSSTLNVAVRILLSTSPRPPPSILIIHLRRQVTISKIEATFATTETQDRFRLRAVSILATCLFPAFLARFPGAGTWEAGLLL